MQWPWVSRYRLEAAEQRLEQVNAERERLLALLLARPEPMQPPPVAAVEAIQEPVNVEQEQGEPAAFSTPFDRLGNRFEQARKSGTIPAQFKARIQ